MCSSNIRAGAAPRSAAGEGSERFKAAFRHHPAGVAVITADDGGGPVGLTATSVIPVSAEPAVLAFSLSAQSSTTPRLVSAETVVVHLLSAGQVEAARRFAASGIDRFADSATWHRLPTGEPVLRGADVWLRAGIAQRVAVGGSTLVVASVLEVRTGGGDRFPLVYQNRTWYTLPGSAAVG
ncbi:flavin reductase [Streptomonospora sp. PA3]|uniref:flavin reductase family protein n=1 Tax=Streptomonospora sp. PA3 TaxID=2607326 RepID=UPI0012DEF26C|nr:flavin reductase family protein [Streptomonospora sp. PA3]MUL44314.1 flavin reductase [Streptomonospora sp. PA3]